MAEIDPMISCLGLRHEDEADWVNGPYVNRVEYSTMTNEVLAVSLFRNLKESI